MTEEFKNKKILLISVGVGSTGKDVAHGINFSISQQNPDIIHLIATKESLNSTIPHLISVDHKTIIKHELQSTDDVENIINELENYLAPYLRKYNKDNITADYTSGTKAMSAALVGFSISNEFNSLSYVTGRRNQGKVVSGSERLSIIRPNKLLNASKLVLFKEFFNHNQFVSAIETLDSIKEIHPDNIGLINFYKLIADAFDKWDKFNFNKSLDIFKKLSEEYESYLKEFGIKSKVELYKTILYKLKDDTLNKEKIIDIISNAKRRFNEGKYDDSIARLYRAIEMLGQKEFLKEFGCKTDEVNVEIIPYSLRDEFTKNYFDIRTQKLKLPLYPIYIVLNQVNNKIGLSFIKDLERIKKLMQLRNSSILAHGLNPISKDVFEQMNAMVLSFSNIDENNLYTFQKL